jgi:hypothetical protein
MKDNTTALPRFMECMDLETVQIYVLHTQTPRILFKLDEKHEVLTWLKGWGDPPPLDSAAARLACEIGDGYFLTEHEF